VTVTLPQCNECTIRRVTLCGTFIEAAPAEYERVARSFQQFASKRIIYRAGTVPNSLLVLRDGWAISYGILSNGRRHIYHFFVPGDAIALHVSPRAPLPYSVQALTRVELCGFSLDMIRQGIKHPKFSETIAERYYDYIRVMEDRLIHVSRYAAAARIASLVLHLRGRLACNGFLKGDVMDFPLTQSHVADALGLTAAHVNRMFAELRNEGIVTFGAGQLTIHDLARLTDLVKSPAG